MFLSTRVGIGSGGSSLRGFGIRRGELDRQVNENTCTFSFSNTVLFSEKTDLGHDSIEDESHRNANIGWPSRRGSGLVFHFHHDSNPYLIDRHATRRRTLGIYLWSFRWFEYWITQKTWDIEFSCFYIIFSLQPAANATIPSEQCLKARHLRSYTFFLSEFFLLEPFQKFGPSKM
jgi:hypothetical protein